MSLRVGKYGRENEPGMYWLSWPSTNGSQLSAHLDGSIFVGNSVYMAREEA